MLSVFLKSRESKNGLLPFTVYEVSYENETSVHIRTKGLYPKKLFNFVEEVVTDEFPKTNTKIQLRFANGFSRTSGLIQKVVHAHESYFFIETTTTDILLVHYVGE